MPDHDPGPDPMDKAYAQAEATLSDEAARAARRARVLAAVEGEPAATPVAVEPPVRPAVWRRGGWLVAASVAGLAALLTFHTYSPARYRPQPPPPAGSAPPAKTRSASEPLDAAAGAPLAKPVAPARSTASESMAAVAPQSMSPPIDSLPPAPPPPPPPAPVMQAPEASYEAAPAPAGRMPEGVTTAQKREFRVEDAARRRLEPAPRADIAGAPPLAASRLANSSATAPAEGAARLHAAAAAGRVEELADLLRAGVPVDAPDADGETALMMSIQAGQPAAAAVLRRHGASLDRRNRAGKSGRDMAKAADDAELDEALGLDR